MNRKPGLTSIVFSILVGLTLMLSAVNPMAAYASALATKSTQTPSPTPSPTPLPAATGTPAPTAMPTPAVPGLSVQSDPTYIVPGGQVVLSYQISDFDKISGTPSLRFEAPSGLTPADLSVGKFDDSGGTFDLPITEPEGKIVWQADDTIAPPIGLSVELLQDGTTLSSAELTLDALTEFEIPTTGGEADGMDGKVKVTFPDGALSENVKVKVTHPSKEDLPVPSLSGSPFELTATSEASLAEVSKFSKPVKIQVHYDWNPSDGDEENMRLVWYDPASGLWEPPLSQEVDTENKIITAYTDHFTVFDTYDVNWQVAETPTLNAFQTSGFTGAATFSMPIQVPPGPGGMQPNLTLAYNSQVVNSVTTNSQASWTGMGWSLDAGGYIENNDFGKTTTGDKTYSLNANGVSDALWLGTDGRYHLENEDFSNITYDKGVWTMLDKRGTKYIFAETAGYVRTTDCPDDTPTKVTKTWRWMLTKVINVHGVEIDYDYAKEAATASHYDSSNCYITNSSTNYIYPQSITYDHDRYRVRFKRIDRYDYLSEWLTAYKAGDDVIFQRSLLNEIDVEQDADGDGTFETTLHKYVFNYVTGPAASIFPDYAWPNPHNSRTPTLQSVSEYGLKGAGPLPGYSFQYGDGMHLTHAENGYGGGIDFSYDNGAVNIPLETIPDGTLEPDIPRWGSPIACQFENGNCGWKADGTGSVGLNSNGYLTVNNNVKKDINTYQPGHWYRIVAEAKSATTDAANLTLKYGYEEDGAQNDVSLVTATLDSSLKTVVTEPFFLPVNAVTFTLKMNADGRSQLYWYYLMPLPTYSRVISRTISDGTNDYPYTYTYGEAATNTPENSGVLQTAHSYDLPYTEFRGSRSVTELDPYGKRTVTEYNQDDDCRVGLPSSVSVFMGLTLRQVATTGYDCHEWDSPTVLTDKDWPIIGGRGQSVQYTGLRYRWVWTTDETQTIYKADGITVDGSLATHYTYQDPNDTPLYGNLLDQTVAGSIPHDLTTHYAYYEDTSSDHYIVLPSHVSVTNDQGATLADTLNTYTNPFANTPDDQDGLFLTTVRTLVDLAKGYRQVNYGYDLWGNVTSTTTWSGYGTATSDPTEGAQTTTTAYDSTYHTYPLSITTPPTDLLPSGLTTTLTYNYRLGVPLTETGPNGAATMISAEYDSFGRLTKLIRPGDDSDSPTLQIAYTDSSPFTVSLTQKIQGSQTYTVTRTYDGLGRPLSVSSGGTSTLYQYGYDGGARADYVSTPFAGSETHSWAETRYDSLGRPWIVTAPDGTQTTYAYDGLTAKVTDANGNETDTAHDVLGHTVFVHPPIGPDIAFGYDDLGNLTSASRGGAETTMQYDLSGRKTSMADPDMGAWTYDYDALNNLRTQTDARDCTLTMTYDNLNRLDTKVSSGTYCGQQINVEYGYDDHSGSNYGIGYRTSMTDGSGAHPTSWEYDIRGRLAKETKWIDSTSFLTQWTYNSADLPDTMTYPDGEVVTNHYNSQMLLTSVVGTETYASALTYDSANRLQAITLGSNLGERFFYKDWTNQGGRLDTIVAGTGAFTDETRSFDTPLMKNTYSYDSVGNITTIYDSKWGETQTFGYDSLNRLTSASAEHGLANYSERYSYNDDTGNLETKKDVTSDITTALDYPSANGSRPHAVTSATADGNASTYEYDDNGNQKTRNINTPNGIQTYQLEYDAENRLVLVSGPNNLTARFTYDGDGRRVKSIINDVTTLFAGGHYEQTGNQVTKYYFAGATRIAVRTYVVSQSNTLNYLVGDQLGSTSLAVDTSTGDVVTTKYKPWGEVRWTTENKTLPTRYTFTGQYSYVSDDATDLGNAGFGLMFYNARWYDPMTGRMAQADTVVPGGVQGLDRYAYAGNSPVNRVDPTGHVDQSRCNYLKNYNCEQPLRYATPTIPPGGAGGMAASSTSAPGTIDDCPHHPNCDVSSLPSLDSGDDWWNDGDSTKISCPPSTPICYEGPIPDNLRAQLEAAGVDPKLLDATKVVIYTTPRAGGSRCDGAAGASDGTTIYICGVDQWSSDYPFWALVHELVHVRQYVDDPYFKQKYFLLSWLTHDLRPYEMESIKCDKYYRASHPELGNPLPDLSLGLCDLGVVR